MKTIILIILIILITLFFSLSTFAKSRSKSCGAKPIPPIGYKVGRCVGGSWEMVSTTGSDRTKCGVKPIPSVGCKVGSCINGSWEQICD